MISSHRFVGIVLAAIASLAPAGAFAGTVVITTPSGHTNIVQTNGVATHVTSNYSAQVNDTFAGPGEHIVVTPNGTHIAQSSGKTATITVISK